MRRAILKTVALALVAVTVAVAGCGGTAPTETAHVAGTVRLCGLVRCFPEQVHVSVWDANGRLVGTTQSWSGRFSLSLAPGSYDVSVQSRHYLMGTASVEAVAEQTAQADFTDRRLG